MNKKITSAFAGAALIVGLGAAATPASAAWFDGNDRYSNCYYEVSPSSFSLQYVDYEKYCEVEFNRFAEIFQGKVDGTVHLVESGNTDIYDTNLERTFNRVVY